jgi:hypothetical protein
MRGERGSFAENFVRITKNVEKTLVKLRIDSAARRGV